MMNSKNNPRGLSILVIASLLIFQQFASKVGNLIANSLDYGVVDEHGIFAYISVHHLVQMLIALLVIIIYNRIYEIDFGFSAGDRRLGMKYLLVFSAAVFGFTVVTCVIRYFGNQTVQYGYPLNTKNVLGTLGFQLLLSGPSEEILFRALPIGILTFYVGSDTKKRFTRLNLSYEVIIAAVLFSIAHIRWTINPFSIDMNYLQLIFCFVLGIVYGKAYQECNSVVYPMVMYSISNVIIVGLGYVFAIIEVSI